MNIINSIIIKINSVIYKNIQKKNNKNKIILLSTIINSLCNRRVKPIKILSYKRKKKKKVKPYLIKNSEMKN